jgi:hypothetical protein
MRYTKNYGVSLLPQRPCREDDQGVKTSSVPLVHKAHASRPSTTKYYLLVAPQCLTSPQSDNHTTPVWHRDTASRHDLRYPPPASMRSTPPCAPAAHVAVFYPRSIGGIWERVSWRFSIWEVQTIAIPTYASWTRSLPGIAVSPRLRTYPGVHVWLLAVPVHRFYLLPLAWCTERTLPLWGLHQCLSTIYSRRVSPRPNCYSSSFWTLT